ncbi:MAG: hypothetical protein ACFFDI_11310 [Promethearchaeota archaeon]
MLLQGFGQEIEFGATTPVLLNFIAWILMILLFGILLVRMILIYRQEKVRTTIYFASYFILTLISAVIGLAMTLYNFGWTWLPFTEDWTLLLFCFQIVAVSFLLVSAFDMADRFRFWSIAALIAIIGIILSAISFLVPEYALPVRILLLLVQFIATLPVIIIFLWVFKKVRSGKALAFALGLMVNYFTLAFILSLMVITNSGEIFPVAELAANSYGLGSIIGTVIIFTGLMGWIDRYILGNIEE